MAKEKIIDLAPKAEKITDEQLKDLQGIIGQVNQAQLSIGQLETQKAGIMAGIGDLQMKLKSMQDSLEEEYGKVTVNIQDGTIKELEDAPDTKD
jgi:TolA-binding protein